MRTRCATPLQDERYLLLEALGRGGMGTVYRAFDGTDQRLVALKVPCTSEDPGPAHPLSTEFDNWSRLRHPNIVRAYSMRHAESGPIPAATPYLVLEHVHGRPTHRALEPGRIDDATAESLAAQLLAALAHVHAAGCVHRDMKPGNVLACRLPGRRLRFKLTDFGLAVRTGASSAVGTFSGSLPYVAPETLIGLPLDGRADLYGLGILLYHLTTGELPVSNGGPDAILHWHLNGPAADPSRLRAALSPRLSRLIRRLTRHDREQRPASALCAMGLLGVRGTPGEDPFRRPVRIKGALASLRLALDAVRLGARREYRLPGSPRIADALVRELTVWSQVRGLRCYRITDDPERLVLRLLADRGGDAAGLVNRFSLNRRLALDMVGGVPLRETERAATNDGADQPVANRRAARAIADLIVDCADVRPIVVRGGRSASRAPLAREVQRRLVRHVAAEQGRGPAQSGGLLLVVEP